ncbi:class I SAM-dependent methyltransferase [Salisediminibacterium selenitireducens]|uniref:SAM-dependent methyltransferase n=1 Tax=Bacillus selenitireducens (strain ATCC 700615 / DSM 15326 / MLS10) TaxID=439292 RepID=D6XU46_BACIE|nr:class I SAM-dependent methyltransferase [Salisediminibacterium selenitireducens]ADH99332.1 protein of unknown function DUF548 [[Bacillus] selenitireducens MLS10]
MMKYYITTSRNGGPFYTERAKYLGNVWGMTYVERKHASIAELFRILLYRKSEPDGIFVVGEQRVELYRAPDEKPLFFHPNTAMFRAKHLIRHGSDPLIEAAGVKKGDRIVDATLGMGADAQILSLAAGEKGFVTGLEGSPDIARITSLGLKSYEHDFTPLKKAMRRIEVYQVNHVQWLSAQPDQSVDIVYFDPMFHEQINKSDGISIMRAHAVMNELTGEAVNEALRISRKRVVLKDHFRSSRFEAFGFKRTVRKSSKVHYGILDHSGGSI